MFIANNKEEFECEMERRRRLYEHESIGGFSTVIRVNPDGTPKTELDKRKVCELQKLALGTVTGYVACSEPRESPEDLTSGIKYNTTIMKGELIREVCLHLDAEDFLDLRPFWLSLIFNAKIDREAGGRSSTCMPTANQVCAFPGGCD